MSEREWRTPDRRFGLRMGDQVVGRLLALCVEAASSETGGILIGYYTDALDCAIVTAISGPPPDSRRGRTWFRRGIVGLRDRLSELWRTRSQYYLGEWHFHPCGETEPSPTDRRQMVAIAQDPAMRCPEPVLLVVGRADTGAWSFYAFIFPRGQDAMALQPCSKEGRDEAAVRESGP